MPTEIAPSSQGGKAVAPVHADVDGELFHEMLEPFDQDQEGVHHELDQQPAIVLARPSDAVELERAQAGDGEPVPIELKQPGKVDDEKMRFHRLSGHAQYQDWCELCVANRGRERGHYRVEDKDSDVPVITCDYNFLTFNKSKETIAQKTPTVLCASDKRSGMCFAVQVLEKGSKFAYGCAAFGHWIDSLGYKRIRLRCDPEPALKDFVRGTIRRCSTTEVVMETVPVASHASMGVGEQVHQAVIGKFRVIKADLEQQLGVVIPPASPLNPWMIRHAAWVRNRFEKRPDGHTPYYNITGCEYSAVVHVFGETVMARIPQSQTKKFSGRFVKAIWLGKAELSDEHFVGNEAGSFMCSVCPRAVSSRR